MKYLDVAAIVLPLAQVIGRLGNFFNKELYGLPTNLPWGLKIDGIKYHPVFAYEMILNLILFSILYTKKFPKTNGGYYFYSYLLGYGLIRALMQLFRACMWEQSLKNGAIAISLCFIAIGTLNLILLTSEKH